jgi:hypothetical protein
LRQDPANIQLSFDQFGPPLGLAWTSSNATINYISNGLMRLAFYVLQGGAKGSHAASVTETISIQNTNKYQSRTSLYDYSDFDLDGQPDGDTVTFPGTNIVMQQGKNMIATQSIAGQTPSFWEGSWYALALDTIENSTPAILPDEITSQPGGRPDFCLPMGLFALSAGQTFVLNLTNSIQSAQALLSDRAFWHQRHHFLAVQQRRNL